MTRMWRSLALLLLTLTFASIVFAQGEPFTMLTMQQVSEMLGKPNVYVFDLNDQEMFAQHHLSNSIHITDEHLRKYLPKDKNATLIFYCAERRCSGSEMAAREAAKLGYKKVFTMPEGIFGWVRSGRETQSEPAARRN